MGTPEGKGRASFIVEILFVFSERSNIFQSAEEHLIRKETAMQYICDVCGWIYDEEEGSPENGIEPGTKWEDVPEDFLCPLCMEGKDQFSEI